jgi:DNA-binding transcriptional regulator YiaG
VDAQTTEELRRRTADAYRKKHGLLTSEEIKALRKLLQKTQTQFAQLVGVGEASVKRWETWLVQDKSSDELMRLKSAQALRNRLVHDPTIMWITFEHKFVPETPAIPADRWKLPVCPADPGAQDELELEDTNESTASPLACAA